MKLNGITNDRVIIMESKKLSLNCYIRSIVMVFERGLHSFRLSVMLLCFHFAQLPLFSQHQTKWVKTDVFQSRYWIKNKGQFDLEFPRFTNIQYVYDAGFASYILTNEGIGYRQIVPKDILVQRTKGEKESKERPALWDTQYLFQRFLGVSNQRAWVASGETQHDFTFGEPQHRSKGYREVVWQNVYPGVDIRFVVDHLSTGIKYTYKLSSGAQSGQVKFKFSVGVPIVTDEKILLNQPDFRFADSGLAVTGVAMKSLKANYHLSGDTVQLHWRSSANASVESLLAEFGEIEIDPYVLIKGHALGSSLHTNEFVVCADHDAFGNAYFYGEAIGYRQKVCKYTPDGTLLWTMVGNPPGVYMRFNSGPYGGIRVDRCSGKVYCLPGSGPPSFFRITENGENDHYWAKPVEPEPSKEFWEIQFVPSKHSMGFFAGAHKFNTDLYNVSDSFPVALESCLTEDSTEGFGQVREFVQNGRDYVNAVVDDHGKIFAVTAQGVGPRAYSSKKYSNRVIAINDSFDGRYWEGKWGFNGFWEFQNSVTVSLRPGFNWLADWLSHNRFNAMAVYDQYLYVYDGKHFVAMDKFTGQVLAADSIAHLTVSYQSGIAVDSCNNIYMGGDSSHVYVYQFDGAKFQRRKVLKVLAGDNRRVFDVKYNFDEHLLYVSGDSFAAAVDCGVPCGNKILLETSYWRSCGEPLWARVKTPDSTLTYSFVWRKVKNNELVRSRGVANEFSDTLADVALNTDYKLYVFVSSFCTGTFKTANFQVKSSFDTAIAIRLCEGDTLYYHGKKAFSGGLYTDSLKTFFGCDSFVRYNVTLLNRSFRDTTVRICRGDTFRLWQRDFTQSGVYRDTFMNVLGCDSIERLVLSVQFDSTTQYFAICEGDSIVVGPHVYVQTGSYLDTFSNSAGCDSLVSTNLRVNPRPRVFVDMDLCNVDSLEYRGKWYRPPFLIQDTLMSNHGCDSVVVIRVRSRVVDANFNIDSSGLPTYRFIDRSVGAMRWFWDFGDGNTSVDASPNHQYVKSSTWDPLRVCLIVMDSLGCSDTLCHSFLLHPEIDVIIPEGFSPNGDSDNESLLISGMWAFPRAEWLVFNRWGQVVFRSDSDHKNSWDGRCNAPECNGALLSEGVYYLVFHYNDGVRSALSKNIYLKR